MKRVSANNTAQRVWFPLFTQYLAPSWNEAAVLLITGGHVFVSSGKWVAVTWPRILMIRARERVCTSQWQCCAIFSPSMFCLTYQLRQLRVASLDFLLLYSMYIPLWLLMSFSLSLFPTVHHCIPQDVAIIYCQCDCNCFHSYFSDNCLLFLLVVIGHVRFIFTYLGAEHCFLVVHNNVQRAV